MKCTAWSDQVHILPVGKNLTPLQSVVGGTTARSILLEGHNLAACFIQHQKRVLFGTRSAVQLSGAVRNMTIRAVFAVFAAILFALHSPIAAPAPLQENQQQPKKDAKSQSDSMTGCVD